SVSRVSWCLAWGLFLHSLSFMTTSWHRQLTPLTQQPQHPMTLDSRLRRLVRPLAFLSNISSATSSLLISLSSTLIHHRTKQPARHHPTLTQKGSRPGADASSRSP
ncbi:hypothetical protein H4582DRAFT_1989055, partial [Lactarius indigo]